MSAGRERGRQYSVARGAVLVVAMRWTDRLIGFLSTLILARLLAPEDFGIIAMAMLVIGLVDVLLDLGVNVALIQNAEATQEHYDTAWTLRLAQTGLATLIVVACAPFAADYFNDPRVEPVLWALGGSLLLAGLENIGVISFQKEMRFGLDFQFVFTKRVIGFVVTVVAAWTLRSYWALVIGMLSLRASGVVLSYLMHDMRPRLSLARFRDIFSVSQWMIVNSIGLYLNLNLHKMIVGRRTDTTTMGGYTLADEISAMPSTELLAPLNRVLFPAFVQARDNPVELKRKFLLAQGVQCVVGIPVGVGLALVAHEAVLVLLGWQWLLAVPFLQMLAIANVLYAVTTSGGYLLMTLGKVHVVALSSWLQVGLFAALALLVVPESGAAEIVWMRMATVLFGAGVLLWVLLATLPGLLAREIAAVVARPALAALLMSAAVLGVGDALDAPVLVALLVKIAIGGLVYPLAVLVMWRLVGRPAGAEEYLIEKAAVVAPWVTRLVAPKP